VESAAAECVLHESEVRTWTMREVTLSALLAADLCLSDVLLLLLNLLLLTLGLLPLTLSLSSIRMPLCG
jgi:hypothetical protein